MRKLLFFSLLSIPLVLAPTSRAADSPAAKPPPTYAQVHAIFAQRCLSCHDSKEAEGDLVMESYASLMAGGENGAVILPGKAQESPLVRQIERRDKPFMPPPKKAEKLPENEIATIRAWIDAGAPGPKPGEIVVAAAPATMPHVEVKGTPRRPVQAMVYEPRSKLLAVARLGEVELRSLDQQGVVRLLTGHAGNVNALALTADGSALAAAGGQAGVAGEVRLWNVATGALIRTLVGHKDAIYCVAISPDGQTLATGSYDQKITLWDLKNGKPVRDLEGHNGAVFGLAFRPDGKVLASVSADRTLKLWEVATGKRLDTRPEPLKDQRCVAFSPDGTRVAAGGNDNRIRIWQVGPDAVEGTNPILIAQFAHPGAVLAIAWSHDGKIVVSSADDGTVKLWDANSPKEIKPLRTLPAQADWPSALVFVEDKTIAVGRADGSVALYDVQSGKELPRPAPEVSFFEPRGVQHGASVRIKLTGKNLGFITSVRVHDKNAAAKLTARVLPDGHDAANSAWVEFTAAGDLPLMPYTFSVVGPGGESKGADLLVDDLPQISETEPNDSAGIASVVSLPCDVWGRFNKRGDADCIAFDLNASQSIVLDIGAKRFGSKAEVVLTVLDPAGKAIAQASHFDGDPDPLLCFTAPAAGRYVARITDLEGGISDDHYYRLSAGSFAYVDGCFPLGVPAKAETRVQLIGCNLPTDGSAVIVKAGEEGVMPVPLDGARYRSRRTIRVNVSTFPELVASDLSNRMEDAMSVPVPGAVSARIGASTKGQALRGGLFRFEGKAGQAYVLETLAARRGSPMDTRIEVLHPDGRPVDRLQLQAVRDSYVTFRSIDAIGTGARFPNYEEMELNQYVYMQGEVVKLFLAPRGPDSEFNFYATGGKRISYFDTTPTAHALDEKCYIVEPHPLGEALPSTGLPVFTLHFENDDDATRRLGSDSHLLFTAPADGPYIARVTDVRGFGGERFVYRLSIHPAKPDFKVELDPLDPRIPAGSGRSFTARLERIDGFEGPVRVDLTGVPSGFSVSTPLVIAAGHLEAKGTIYATADAKPPTTQAAVGLRAAATALIDGTEIRRPVLRDDAPKEKPEQLATLTLASKSPLRIWLEPWTESATTRPTAATQPATIELIPGKLVPALLRIERNNLPGPVTFELENLPHGVIVADIGLNGVLIPDGQTERQIFISCAPWVAETTRLCFARAKEAGGPTSGAVMVHVRGGQ